MERSEIDAFIEQSIIGSDEREIQEAELAISELTVSTTCQCGNQIEIYNQVPSYCECGRKHELITYLRTEWAANQDEVGE